MRTRRIAIFLPSLLVGGGSFVALEVAKGLVRRGLAVDLLLARAEGEYLERVPGGVRLIAFDSWHPVTSLPKLVRYLRRERPEALVATLRSSIAVALTAKRFFAKDLPTIVLQQVVLGGEFEYSGFASRMLLRAVEGLLPCADAIVAVSRGVAEDLERRVPAASHLVQTIWNPVVGCEQSEKAALPVEHPWFGDPRLPVLLSVGRLEFQKDYPTLLRAFAEVVKSRPAHLVILGEGPDRDNLTALARQLGIADRVDFPGFEPNPFAWMARAQVFVLSSRYEGLPTVLIEAMACGTPVASTDCPSGPGEILEGGKWGRLAPVGDWRSLAQAIVETLDNPASPEGLIARAGAFSVDSAIDRYMALLDRLVYES